MTIWWKRSTKGPSAIHYESANKPGKTLCGVTVPDHALTSEREPNCASCIKPIRNKRIASPKRDWAAKPITEGDVKNSIKMFLKDGGVIKQIPAQQTPLRVAHQEAGYTPSDFDLEGL